jgi:hypothetical protein
MTGNSPIYRFYISEASSLTYEVFPSNFLSTTLIDEPEKGQLFYRRKFNGKLIFGSNSRVKDYDGIWHNRCDDWDLLWEHEQYNPCEKLYLQINKIVQGVVYPYWDGYILTPDGEFDIDEQTFQITPVVNDEYSLLLEHTKLQYNILVILVNLPEVSTNANDGLAINETYTHNHWLMDVMQYLIDPFGIYGISVVSHFFTDLPNNYVTGLPNKLTKLTIAQKSDILRPASANPARYPKGQLSWDELMEILKGMFQVYWVYDHLTDTVHVEHISWFVANDGLDLRTQALCKSTNVYEYVKEKMPKYESFKWMEADNAYFVGDSIRYDSGCVDQNPDSNTVETSIPVTTDLEFIYNSSLVANQTAISDDGWVILQNSGAGPIYDVDSELAAGGTEVKLNMHLSWASLHLNYFRHNRVMIEGYINNSPMTFESSQGVIKQQCTAIICDSYNPNDSITTELGETYFNGEKARVNKAEISPTGWIKFTLLYGTHYLTPAPTPGKWIKVIMVPSNFTDHCTHFHAELSEPAPVGGLNIEFRYVILPGSGPAVCANAAGDDIWNIAEGLTTDEYDIVLDCAIPSGGCIYYWHPGANDIPGWTIDFVYDETCRC